MKQYQISFDNRTNFSGKLAEIKAACAGRPFGDITFYLTWTESAQADVAAVTETIEEQFPDAIYYGNEASGNIAMGRFSFGIHVTCTIFEAADSKTELVWVEQGSELSTLKDLWEYCGGKEGLRAIELIPSMSYVETLRMDGNIPDIGSDVLIFGGASVNYDSDTYDADIIASGHPRTMDGMAVLLYFGSSLAFSSSNVLGWKGLGRQLEVTAIDGKCIREIDGSPAFAVYEKYLNLTLEDKDTLVFPLIAEEDGYEFIRTPQIILPDKSMQMFAYIPKGTKVRISYGDKNTILAGIYSKVGEIEEFRPEAIKVYSCAARRLFWGDSEVSRETVPLQSIAGVSGFYTGGEILRFGERLRVLNQTLAIVSMREGEGAEEKPVRTEFRPADKSLISRLTYFSEKIVEEEKSQRLLAEGFEKALASEFQVVYFIDLATGKTAFLHGDEEAKNFSQIFSTNTAEGMFANFQKYYVDAAVLEEDRERVRSVMNAENVLRVLEHANSLSVNYRVRRNLVDPVYTEMRIIKAGEENGRPTAIVLAFKQTDEELRAALRLNEKLQGEIINEMLDAEGLFLINSDTGRRKTIHDRSRGRTSHSDDENFFESFPSYVNTFVAEADRARLLEAASQKYMQERLKTEKEYSVVFRSTSKGIQRFFEMKFTRFSESEVLQSFTQKDKEIIDEMILTKMEDDYFALFAVDLDTGLARIQKKSPWYLEKEVGEITPYSPMIQAFRASMGGEATEFFSRISDIDYLKRRFSSEDKASYTYKAGFRDGEKWVTATELVLTRYADGTPQLFALGFSFLDEEASQIQDIQQKLREDAQIIGALSEDFRCVDYVELTGNKAGDAAVIVRISALMKKLLPEWERETVFTKKLDMLEEFVFEDDRQAFHEATRREKVFRELNASNTYIVSGRMLLENRIHYYQVQFSAIRNRGQLTGIVVGLRSVDEQMKKEIEAQKRLEEALENAEVANRSKSSFLFNMSHDIRTPMNAIKGFTAMAKKYLHDTEKVSDYLDKIDLSGQQLLTLINRVLEMSRIESGKIEFDEKPVNIMEQFNSLVTVIEAQATLKGLEFHSSIRDLKHNNVYADDSRMGQITLNVAGNAIKYTPEGGRIDFEFHEIPGRRPGYGTYVFTVADTGIGMSREFLKELFVPFSREKTSTVSKIQGTGLGMAIVKNLVDLMGGDIEVRSEPGKGTRFDITVDLALVEKEETVEESSVKTRSASFEGLRVLLVEDNEMNREIAKDILEEYGFLVEEADDGDVAVERCRELARRGEYRYYDFILMDIQMPRMNGYEATRAIRDIPTPDHSHVPIIAMTANAFAEDRQNAFSAGMDEHLAKPIEIQKLLETLAKFL